jgi:hypothetical protein
MNHRAVATFEIASWEQSVYDEPAEGPTLSRATVKKSFSGEVEGTSVAELLMCQADDDHAGYLGSERFSGAVGDRSGTFVIQHGGIVDGEHKTPFGQVVPGSGTGELTGLRGTVAFQHDEKGAIFTLHYHFV